MSNPKRININVAASMIGVCAQTLRRWDERGKLSPVRAENGYRSYELFEVKNHISKDRARPFLKWAGGKTQLLHELLPLVPNEFDNYYEPFLGGGALFFALQPKRAELNDINPDLVNCYLQVRDSLDSVVELLEEHQKRHDKKYYYQIREQTSLRSKVKKAARFIYLNKTCYNGLYRVNRNGHFNVPIGNYKNPKILDLENLSACSKALQNTEIFNLSYKDFLRNNVAGKGSFVYLDPPYIPVSEYSDFDRYTKEKFRIGDQFELALQYGALVDRGCYALLSNSSSELSERLYSYFKVRHVKAARSINKSSDKRGKVTEVLVGPERKSHGDFPSTRYMGSKSNLIPHIHGLLEGIDRGTALDLFSGSGVVSYHLKKLGFKVISNDFLHYSSNVTKALIENNNVKLVERDLDLLLRKNRRAKKFVQNKFKEIYFSDEDNFFVDNFLANVELLDCEYKRAIARSSLSRACLKRRPRGIFTYVGFKYDDGRKDLSYSLKDHFLFAVGEFNAAVFDNGRCNHSLNGDALSVELSEELELVYLDPPYFSMHSDNDYLRRYHFIEGVCRNWQGVEIQEHTKTKKFLKYPSAFDTKVGSYEAFQSLIESYKNSKMLISYSSNSFPVKDELCSMLRNSGKEVELHEIDYTYSFGNQNASKNTVGNRKAQEYLFFAY